MRARTRAVAAAVLIVTTGCYSYVPAEFDTVPVGEGVRVYLSRTGVERLRELGGDDLPGAGSDQPMVSGTLVRRTGSDFSLLIPVASRQVGFIQSELGQQVTLPTEAVVQVQLRRLSQTRTILALIGSTGAIATLIVGIIKGARDPIPTPDPGSSDLRAPVAIPVP